MRIGYEHTVYVIRTIAGIYKLLITTHSLLNVQYTVTVWATDM